MKVAVTGSIFSYTKMEYAFYHEKISLLISGEPEDSEFHKNLEIYAGGHRNPIMIVKPGFRKNGEILYGWQYRRILQNAHMLVVFGKERPEKVKTAIRLAEKKGIKIKYIL